MLRGIVFVAAGFVTLSLSAASNDISLIEARAERSSHVFAPWTAIAPDQPAVGGDLVSGVPAAFSVGPLSIATLFTGENAYRITVPAGARRLEVKLATSTPGVKADVFMRFGVAPELSADGGVLTNYGAAGYSGYEGITVTTSSSPALQPGVYYIAIGLATTGVEAGGTITATYSSVDQYPGQTLESSVGSSFSLPAVEAPTLFTGIFGRRIDVPAGATRLEIASNAVLPDAAADIDLYLRHGSEPVVEAGGVASDHESTSPAGAERIIVDSSSVPPLRAGVYFVALALHTFGTEVEGLVTASVTMGGPPQPQPPRLEISPPSLNFSSNVGANPTSQNIAIRNSGGGALNYSVETTDAWLSVSPANGSSTGETDSIAVSVSSGGLAEGVHTAQVRVDGGSAGVASVDVTLTLSGVTPPPTGAPVITSESVVNGADFTDSFSPGIIVSIFGQNLAASTAGAQATPLPTSLDGVSVEVLVDGAWTPLPLFFVSAGQINAQLLYRIPLGLVALRVRTPVGVSDQVFISVSKRSPRLLTKTLDGEGEAILLHADYTLVSEENPATPGEVLILYLSGLGPVSPEILAGQKANDGSAGSELNLIEPRVTVRVAAQETIVHYAGLAPGWIGLYQINFQTPLDVTLGAISIVVDVEGQASQSLVAFYCGLAWQTLSSASVGPSGGTVFGGEVSLAVSPGALDGQAQLTIEKAMNPPPGAPGQVSGTFSVKGLPLSTNGPITVEAEATRGIPEGDVYLVVNEFGEGSAELWVQARVEQGRLIAELPPRQAPEDDPTAALKSSARRNQEPPAGLIQRISMFFLGARRTRTQGRFRVNYPTDVVVDTLLSGFEEADTKLTALGFSTGSTSAAPIDVRITRWRSRRGEAWGRAQNIVWTRDAEIHVVRSLLEGPVGLVQPKAAHLFFHHVQGLYTPRGRVFESSERSWLWFDEAAAIWFERWFAPGRDSYIPREALANRRFLSKHGLQYPLVNRFLSSNINEARQHGYGASMFVEFLNHQAFPDQPSWLSMLYQQKAMPSSLDRDQSAVSPVEALDATPQIGIREAWTGFVLAYALGQIYPDGQGWREIPDWDEKLLAEPAVSESHIFSSDKDVTFRWKSQDLSARFYHVSFHRTWAQTHLDSTVNVQVASTGQDARALLLDSFEGEMQGLIGQTDTGFQREIGRFVQDGTNLFVAAVNIRAREPYDEFSNIETRVSVKDRPSVLDNLTAAAHAGKLHLRTNWRAVGITSDGTPFTGISIDNNIGASKWKGEYRPIRVNGSEFTAEFIRPITTSRSCDVTMSVRLSDEGQTLETSTTTQVCRWTVGASARTSTDRFTLENVGPVELDFSGRQDHYYRVRQAELSRHLVRVERVETENGVETRRLLRIEWDAELEGLAAVGAAVYFFIIE